MPDQRVGGSDTYTNRLVLPRKRLSNSMMKYYTRHVQYPNAVSCPNHGSAVNKASTSQTSAFLVSLRKIGYTESVICFTEDEPRRENLRSFVSHVAEELRLCLRCAADRMAPMSQTQSSVRRARTNQQVQRKGCRNQGFVINCLPENEHPASRNTTLPTATGGALV